MKKTIVILLSMLFFADFALALKQSGIFIYQKDYHSSGIYVSGKIVSINDYCKTAIKIKDDFSRSLQLLSSSFNGGHFSLNVHNGAAKKSFCPASAVIPCKHKKSLSAFSETFVIADAALPTFFKILIFIILAVLLYVGLLRLFDSHLNKSLMEKTGFAF